MSDYFTNTPTIDDIGYITNTPLSMSFERIINMVLKSSNLSKYIKFKLVDNNLQLIGVKDDIIITEVQLNSHSYVSNVVFDPLTMSITFTTIDENGAENNIVVNLQTYVSGNGIEICNDITCGVNYINLKLDNTSSHNYLETTDYGLKTTEQLHTILNSKLNSVIGDDAIQTVNDIDGNESIVSLLINNDTANNIELKQDSLGLSANIDLVKNLTLKLNDQILGLYTNSDTVLISEVTLPESSGGTTPMMWGNGLNNDNNTVSVVIDDYLSDKYLKVGEGGIYLTDITTTFNEINKNIETLTNKANDIDASIIIINENINNINLSLSSIIDRIVKLENK